MFLQSEKNNNKKPCKWDKLMVLMKYQIKIYYSATGFYFLTVNKKTTHHSLQYNYKDRMINLKHQTSITEILKDEIAKHSRIENK